MSTHVVNSIQLVIQDLEGQKAMLDKTLAQLYAARATAQGHLETPLLGVPAPTPAQPPAVKPARVRKPRTRQDKTQTNGTTGRVTYYDRISQHLRQTANRPQTIDELAQAVGIDRAAVSAVLYRTHRDQFNALKAPQGKNKLWELVHGSGPDLNGHQTQAEAATEPAVLEASQV